MTEARVIGIAVDRLTPGHGAILSVELEYGEIDIGNDVVDTAGEAFEFVDPDLRSIVPGECP